MARSEKPEEAGAMRWRGSGILLGMDERGDQGKGKHSRSVQGISKADPIVAVYITLEKCMVENVQILIVCGGGRRHGLSGILEPDFGIVVPSSRRHSCRDVD